VNLQNARCNNKDNCKIVLKSYWIGQLHFFHLVYYESRYVITALIFENVCRYFVSVQTANLR